MRKKILILILFMFFPYLVFAQEDKTTFFKNQYDTVTLSKCVDGNSARFMLGNNEIKVKFLGIDTSSNIITSPADEINGALVSDYVCSILENAKDIKIEYEPNSEKEDKYGRLLVWVYVDDVLLQENLLKQGYSTIAYLYDDYSYSEVLKEAESYAKDNKLGVWQEKLNTNVNTNINTDDIEDDNKEESKNIFSMLMNFLNEIFEKFLKFIDDLINNML